MQNLSVNDHLHDTQQQLEAMRTRLAICEQERNAAERRADRAELREMYQRDRRSQLYCPNPLLRARNYKLGHRAVDSLRSGATA
jgi:hypothetical protein